MYPLEKGAAMTTSTLNKLVKDYMESEFVNNSRDIGFYKARAELLANATISAVDNLTQAPSQIKNQQGAVLANPIVADANGVFSGMASESDVACSFQLFYQGILTIKKSNGVVLCTCPPVTGMT